MKKNSVTGLVIALLIIFSWAFCILMFLQWHFSWHNPMVYLCVLLMMHLYTGLFITAHDAMHGTVTPRKKLNDNIGQVCTFLYALFPYRKLYVNHHRHHRHVHSAEDPDFSDKGFWGWYVKFVSEYLSWWQVVSMAIIFNILKIWISQANLFMFWVLPSLLSTLQLFYFGTWLPHHGEPDNRHYSRSLNKNHLWAFITCYFFGYHYEHHESPGIPWWRLWQTKTSVIKR